MTSRHVRFRRSLMTASAAAAIASAAGSASAQTATVDRPEKVGPSPLGAAPIVDRILDPQIVIANPGTSTTSRDPTNVTGIGQMVVDQQNGSVGLCTGTLINPRTVLFAAHCVNSRAATAYGANSGGTAISFGFQANNLPPLLLWYNSTISGQANPLYHKSNPDQFLYNVSQVRYNPLSLETAARGFLYGDVATATLDTPTTDIPTWAMLFSALPTPAGSGPGGTGYNVQIAGYGANGNATTGAATGSDFRRRIAENVVGALTDLKQFETFLFGSSTSPTQNLYFIDFDDPKRGLTGASPYDFNAFRDNARANEGLTAAGDSGGPLILQDMFSRQLTLGVLSGGYTRFYNGQPANGYGTASFYQPLFLYWDWIAQNNPYRYVTNKSGDRDWTNAAHWKTTVDPNYFIIGPDGNLVNGVPNDPGLQKNGTEGDFGEICFQNTTTSECRNTATGQEQIQAKPIGTAKIEPMDDVGFGLLTPPPPPAPVVPSTLPAATIANGLPGASDFVPNNLDPVRLTGAIGRYFDVTLAGSGRTRLTSAVTVDRFNLTGRDTTLRINPTGSLTVLGDYTQIAGSSIVHGRLQTGEALLMGGLLGGSGTFNPTFLTVIFGAVSPGEGGRLIATDTILSSTATLTVSGNVILSSGSLLAIDLGRTGSDVLAVIKDSSTSTGDGVLTLSNGTVSFRGAAGVRDGQSFAFATAQTAREGVFGKIVLDSLGVLAPVLSYNSNSVVATFRAGSLVAQAAGSPSVGSSAMSFAAALDTIRSFGYDSLQGVYGTIDLMDPAALGRALSSLTPSIAMETRSLQDRQSKVMLGAITDRLSSLGSSGTSGTLSIVGSPGSLIRLASADGQGGASYANQQSFASSMTPSVSRIGALPAGFSGFISGGFERGKASIGDSHRSEVNDRRSWQVGMGLEMALNDHLTLGTAFAVANGNSLPGVDESRTDSRSTQAAFYGSYRPGGGVYLAGVAAIEQSRATLERHAGVGDTMFDLYGATTSKRHTLQAEAGVNLKVLKGLTLAPRASLGYASYKFGGYRETGGEAALQLDDLAVRQLDGRLGAKLTGSARFAGGWTFVPQLQGDLVHQLAGSKNGLRVRFANVADHLFTLPLASGDANWAEVKGGFKLSNGTMEFGAGIEKSVGRTDYSDERAMAVFKLGF